MNKSEKLYQLYHQLNKAQQNLFNLMYGSIDTIKEEKIDWVIKQCERTVKKNVEKRDQKIEQIISTPIISQLPNIKVNGQPREQEYTKDGKIPEPGDLFYYQSQYSDQPLEGQVQRVHNGSIFSANGVPYDFKQITIKSKAEFREEKLNEILNGKNN
jgi:hypothetical protein